GFFVHSRYRTSCSASYRQGGGLDRPGERAAGQDGHGDDKRGGRGGGRRRGGARRELRCQAARAEARRPLGRNLARLVVPEDATKLARRGQRGEGGGSAPRTRPRRRVEVARWLMRSRSRCHASRSSRASRIWYSRDSPRGST